jgi:uncharacterized protein YeaO (DUF488 family)
MLRQATVSDLVSDRVSREKGYVVITMRRYPRFINRMLRDEYLSCMSPDRPLFEDWLSAKRRFQDHDGAFGKVKFEQRFDVDAEGLAHLARICEMAEKQDVYLVCQCHAGKRCHREFLLILAKRLFKAKVEKPCNRYPTFEKRIPAFRKKWKAIPRKAEPK